VTEAGPVGVTPAPPAVTLAVDPVVVLLPPLPLFPASSTTALVTPDPGMETYLLVEIGPVGLAVLAVCVAL
jgi:hypothetical protein